MAKATSEEGIEVKVVNRPEPAPEWFGRHDLQAPDCREGFK